MLKILVEKKRPLIDLKLNLKSGAERSEKNASLYFLMAGEFVVLISIFFAVDKVLALYKYGWFLMGLGLFFMLINKDLSNRLKLIYSLAAGIFLQALLAIWQFLTQTTFANKFLGLAIHNPAQLGTVVVEFYRQGVLTRYLRAYGGLDHPNMLGALMAIGILLLANLLIQRTPLNIKDKFRGWFLVINYGLLFFFSVALLFSFSRSAWLATVVGLMVMIIANWRLKFWPQNSWQNYLRNFWQSINFRSLEIRLVIGFGLALIIILGCLFNLMTVRFSTQDRLEKISVTERLSGFSQALQIIKAQPLTGIGIGNYTLALWHNYPTQPAYYYQPVPNIFLLIWSELGIFGILAFGGFWLVLFWEQIKKPHSAALGWALLAALTVLMMVDHWLWSLHFGLFLFWLTLGLI